MQYLGAFRSDQTIDFKFTTVDATGAPASLTSGTISIYKTNSTTQTTTGVTLAADFDSVTGLNQVRVVMTDAFFNDSGNYQAVITAGTVDGVSVAGYVVANWTIEHEQITPGAVDNSAIASAAITAVKLGTNTITSAKIANEAINASKIATDAIDADALAPDAIAEIVDAWEAQSQADPTGFRVNVMEVNGTAQTASDLGVEQVPGTAQGAGTGSDTLQLEAGQVSANDEFNGRMLTIVQGAGYPRSRLILDTVLVDNEVQVAGGNWEEAPDSTTVYIIS